MLDVLDEEQAHHGHPFVRYADDCKSFGAQPPSGGLSGQSPARQRLVNQRKTDTERVRRGVRL
jgi:hypothetical protein